MNHGFLDRRMPIDAIQPELPDEPSGSPVAGVDCSATAAQMTVREAVEELLAAIPGLPNLDILVLGAPERLQTAIRRYSAVAVLRAVLSEPS